MAERGGGRPLPIDSIELAAGGRIGLTHCPGRGGGGRPPRSLAGDLDAIERWGARIVVTLLERRELASLGAADLEPRARERAFLWHHAPIPDMGTPDAAGWAAWRLIEPALVETLGQGGRVLLHCAAGLGRSGMMAARLLVDGFAYSPEAAIALVRRSRPGAIETAAQEAFIARPRVEL